MITKISNINPKFNAPKISFKNTENHNPLNFFNESDSFYYSTRKSKPKFILPSGEYTREEIDFAKDKLDATDEEWKLEMYRDIYAKLKLNRPTREFTSRYGGATGHADMNNPIDRVLFGILSLGLNELHCQIENLGYRNHARDTIRKMDILRADLQNIKLKEQLADVKKEEKYSEDNLKYMKKLDEVKEKQLKTKLLDLIQRQREGRPTDMPNCIMLSNPNNKTNQSLIEWAGENVNGRFISIESCDDIVSLLEEAEENYQSTNDWNLIYIKDLDKYIDHTQVDDWVVEGMKDIMSAAAENYHTTFIFSSTHPESLDKIALQPHRIKKIDTKNIKHPDDIYIEDAKDRLKNNDYLKNTPISAINDLLILANKNKSHKLIWEHTPDQLNLVEEIINKNFDQKDDKKYLNIYKEAFSHLS